MNARNNLSLSTRIVASLRFLDRTLDSSWAYVASLFSKPRTTLTPATQSDQRQKGRWWWLKLLVEILALVSAILGVTGFVLTTRTKLSVDVSGSLQSANPMATVFSLSNDGTLPIHSVMAVCGAVQFTMGKWQMESGPDAGFIFPESKTEILSPGHKMTLPCGHVIGPPVGVAPTDITRAEITIVVHYRPDWWPWHKTMRFPWKAEKTQDGTWIWKSMPQ